MELAVITDEISQDLDHALTVMAEYGITNAEIRGTWDVNIADASNEHIERIQATIKKHGAKVIGIATPIFKCDLPNVHREGPASNEPLFGAAQRTFTHQLETVQRCIDIALMLNTKFIRVFTFYKSGDLTPEVEATIVEAFKEPARLAEAAGVILLVENEHACFTGTGAETARLLAKIDSPAVRSVWDPGNAYIATETPFPDGYEAIKPFVAHVHVKDAKNGSEWAVVGEGDIDWRGQLRALKADHYSGLLSLETHYSAAGNPETCSRLSLRGLQRLLQEL